MSTPTIGVNLCWLVPGVVGGSEEYATRLLRDVEPLLERSVRLRLYARPDFAAAHPDLAETYPIVEMPSNVGSVGARIGLEHSWLAAMSRHDQLVHHLGGTVPLVRPVPAIVTVHDLQPVDLPRNFHPLKRHWLQRMLPHSVRAARLVLCPSRFTADRIAARYGVDERKLRVVFHGLAGGADNPPPASSAAGRAASPADRFGRFVLYPAIAYRHKRHVDVVRAIAHGGPGLDEVSVVFTGRPGPESAEVVAEAERLGLRRRVHVLGRVPADDLERLYRHAEALVFPSTYEGFGNPALESMALGCPVIAADAGALPEVVADAGLIVPAADVPSMAAAISSVVTSCDLAEELRRRGRQRAGDFTARAGAEHLLTAYEDALAMAPASAVGV